VIITFQQLLTVVAPYLGRSGVNQCSLNDPSVRLKAASLLQEFVQRSGTLRKWTIYARDNCFTLPKDLAVILKVKIGDIVDTNHSHWYEFYDQFSQSEFSGCPDFKSGTVQEVNNFATIHDMPSCGGYVLAEIGRRCKDLVNAYVIVQGISADTGEDVYTSHKGELIHGERLDLEQGVKKRSRTRFKRITNITKTETDDYVKFYSQVDKSAPLSILSLMSPKDTVAEFRRAKIYNEKCNRNECFKVQVLGRVSIQSDYHDNDVIPITDLTAIETLAQAKQAVANNNIAAAGFKYQLTDRQIDDEKLYNKVTDVSIDVNIASSPGDIDYLI
jgi:hypothetical protein